MSGLQYPTRLYVLYPLVIMGIIIIGLCILPKKGIMRRDKPWLTFGTCLAILFVFINTGPLVLAFIHMCFFVVVSIMTSRRYAKKVREMQTEYFNELMMKRNPVVNVKALLNNTCIICFPFYLVWVAVSFFIPMGGSGAWGMLSFPVLALTSIPLYMIGEVWKSMRVSRTLLFGVQFAIYALCVAVGTGIYFFLEYT